MSKEAEKNEALRRFTIISALLEPGLTASEASARRRTLLAARSPDGEAVLSSRTLRRWLETYHAGGFDALKPRHRCDYGLVKTITQDVMDAAIAFKEELPTRSVRAILEILEQEGLLAKGAVPRATLDRHLRRMGVMVRQRAPQPHGVRRFQKEHRNQLWQADLKYGPYLPDPKNPGKMCRTYLLAFIDDATRLVPYAAFFFEQRELQLEIAFKWAVLRYGLPDKIYVDNGKIFVANHFKLACAHLNVRHAHTAPYNPQAKGKIERFMGRVDAFINEVKLAKAYTIETLNDTFAVWLEEGYNRMAHDGLDGRTPQEAFANDRHPLRPADQTALYEAFLHEESRKVDKTGCVKFRGKLWEAGVDYARKSIRIKYIELSDGPHDITFYIGDKCLGTLNPLEWNRPFDPALAEKTFVDMPEGPTRSRYLDVLKEKGKKRRQEQGGIHFRQLSETREENKKEGTRDV